MLERNAGSSILEAAIQTLDDAGAYGAVLRFESAVSGWAIVDGGVVVDAEEVRAPRAGRDHRRAVGAQRLLDHRPPRSRATVTYHYAPDAGTFAAQRFPAPVEPGASDSLYGMAEPATGTGSSVSTIGASRPTPTTSTVRCSGRDGSDGRAALAAVPALPARASRPPCACTR